MRGLRAESGVASERWRVGVGGGGGGACERCELGGEGARRGLRKRFLAITRWVYYRNSVLIHERNNRELGTA